MSEDKQIAGPILSLVGGLVILVTGIVETYVGYVANVGFVTDVGLLGGLFGFIIIVLAICGFIYLESHRVVGVLVIVFALLSLVNSDAAGFILAVLGGTCIIVFGPDDPSTESTDTTAERYYTGIDLRPTPPSKAEEPPPIADKDGRTHLACPSCGAINPIPATMCVSCGANLRP